MTSALKEIVDRYEGVCRIHGVNETALISRARAELERGSCCGESHPRQLLMSDGSLRNFHDVDHAGRKTGVVERGVDVRRLLKEWSMDSGSSVESMSRALRAQGVRVVEDGKESSDGK